MKLTVLQRIALGFGCLVILIVALTLFSVWNTQGIQRQISVITEHSTPLLAHSNDHVRQLLQANKIAVQHLLATEQHVLDGLEQQFFQIKENNQSNAKALSSLVEQLNNSGHTDLALKDAYTEIETQVSEFFKHADKAIQFSRQAMQVQQKVNDDRVTFELATEELTTRINDALLAQQDDYVVSIGELFNESFISVKQETLDALASKDAARIRRIVADNYSASQNLESLAEQLLDEIPQYKENIQPLVATFIQAISNNSGVLLQHQKQREYVEQANQQMAIAATNVNSGTKELNQLIATSKSLADQANRMAADKVDDNNQTSLILSIAATILAILVAWQVSKSIIRPLTRMNTLVEQVTEGDLTVRLTHQSRDEFDALAGYINTLVGQLDTTLKSIGQEAATLSEIANSSLQMANQTKQGTVQQRQKTQVVATAINELDSSATEVSRSAEQAQEAIKEASKQSESGLELINQTVKTIRHQADMNQEVADALAELDNFTKRISTIVDVINGIAEQTNLLALNASIEAARAGEHGRGFAVVADEVRTLATRTRTSTTEINGMIKHLVDGSRNTVQLMENSLEDSKKCVSHANQAESSFATIADHMNHILTMSTHISQAAYQQQHTVGDINQNVHEIAHIAETNEQRVQEQTEYNQQLAELSQHQRTRLARFQCS
jgi:methyl-accepting chemotaxis protein|tara:strand:+ start:14579 stop:16594 length:2016 start_codon:yes stop_codon:yes gene_type:complete